MNFDFTIHPWSLIVQLATLASVIVFCGRVYKVIKSVVDASLVILQQHREMYSWYRKIIDERQTKHLSEGPIHGI